jgi:hypothetical protein
MSFSINIFYGRVGRGSMGQRDEKVVNPYLFIEN